MSYSVKAPLAIIQLDVPPTAVSDRVGDQVRWFVQALYLQNEDYIVVRPHLGEALPDYAAVSAAILSGSWAMVTDHAEWSERTAAWIRGAIENQLPLLGVCYGHQLMAYALGGVIADNPRGWERGLLRIEQQGHSDALLAGLPAEFDVWLSHRQSVLTPPQGARVLARSDLENCQIIRYSPQALSVQFHPEFNAQIMLASVPGDVNLTRKELVGVDWARRLLEQFYLNAQVPGTHVS